MVLYNGANIGTTGSFNPGTETLPGSVLDGTKTDIDAIPEPLSVTAVAITKGILVRIDSLGGSAFVKFGNNAGQHLSFTTVNSFVFIDWANDLSKIYVVGDGVGADAEISWTGG